MSSPTKKRKLNGDNKPQVKGLEYFFSKQRSKDVGNTAPENTAQEESSTAELTDEELARKLQAEWDKEAAEVGMASSQTQANGPAVETEAVIRPAQTPPSKGTQGEIAAEPTAKAEPVQFGKGTLKLQSAGMDEDTTTTEIPLDQSPLIFEPSKYIPSLQQHWAADGGNASYALLTRCFVLVSGTTSRIKTVDTLVNCMRLLIEGDPESLLPAVSNALIFQRFF